MNTDNPQPDPANPAAAKPAEIDVRDHFRRNGLDWGAGDLVVAGGSSRVLGDLFGRVHRAFYALSRQTGLRAPGARNGPRLHDFRHRFAIQVLIRWYESGEDPSRRLPVLSTYLGHVYVAGTYWYLSNWPELMAQAMARLERRWGESS
jgi:integrase